MGPFIELILVNLGGWYASNHLHMYSWCYNCQAWLQVYLHILFQSWSQTSTLICLSDWQLCWIYLSRSGSCSSEDFNYGKLFWSPGEDFEPNPSESWTGQWSGNCLVFFCLDLTARDWLPSILSPGERSKANYLVRGIQQLIWKLKYCL